MTWHKDTFCQNKLFINNGWGLLTVSPWRKSWFGESSKEFPNPDFSFQNCKAKISQPNLQDGCAQNLLVMGRRGIRKKWFLSRKFSIFLRQCLTLSQIVSQCLSGQYFDPPNVWDIISPATGSSHISRFSYCCWWWCMVDDYRNLAESGMLHKKNGENSQVDNSPTPPLTIEYSKFYLLLAQLEFSVTWSRIKTKTFVIFFFQ